MINTTNTNTTTQKPNISDTTESTVVSPQNVNDNETKDYQQQGFGLSERPKTAIGDRFGTVMYSRRNEVVQEKPWVLTDMVQRFNYVDTYPWSTSDTPHTILGKLRIPEDLITNDLVNAPFRNMILFHGGADIHIQTTSVPANLGKVICVFVPLCTEEFIESTIIPNFSAMMVNPHVCLYANTNTSAVLSIPFNSPQTYLDINKPDPESFTNTLGHLYIVVFNQLIALGSNTTDIRVMSRLTNTEFKLPRLNGVTQPLRVRATPQSADIPHATSKGIFESVIGSVLPKNIIADGIKGIAGILGLDKPRDITVDLPVKVLGTQRMNTFKGRETIDTMAYDPTQIALCDPETFASNIDEMEIDHMKSIRTYLGTFKVSTEQTVGTIVASWPMCPQPDRLESNRVNQISLLGYMTKLAAFWRGGITFYIETVASSLQTCTLVINFNYDTFEVASAGSLPITASQYGKIFEINQGSNEFTFTAEYAATTPYLNMPNTNIPDVTNSMGQVNISIASRLVSPSNTATEASFNVYIAGAQDFEMSVYPFSSHFFPIEPSNIPLKKVNKKKYIFPSSEESESSDIEVIVVNRSDRKKSKAKASPQSGYSAQPMITPVNMGQQAGDDVLANGSNSLNKRPLTMQTNFVSARDLLKKYQYIYRDYIQVTSEEIGGSFSVFTISSLFGSGGAFVPANTSPLQVLNTRPGYFNDITPLYRMFKGGIRFKIMINQIRPDYNFSIFYIPPSPKPVSNDALQTLAATSFLPILQIPQGYQGSDLYAQARVQNKMPIAYVNGIDKTAEFEIPFSSRYNSVLVRSGLNELSSPQSDVYDLGTLAIYAPAPTSNPPNTELIPIDIFASLADESRFGTMYNVPSVQVNTLVTTGGAIFRNMYPDTYVSSAPIVNTLVRL